MTTVSISPLRIIASSASPRDGRPHVHLGHVRRATWPGRVDRPFGKSATAAREYHARVSYQSSPAGTRERQISPAGIIVVAIGAVLTAVAMFALHWISAEGGGFTFNVKLSELHDGASGFSGIDKVYFSWLVYAVAGATVLFAVLATIPQAFQMASKAIAVASRLAFGVIISFVVFTHGHVDVGDRGIGFWLYNAGLVVLAVGALIPSRPVVTYIAGYGMPTQQDKFRSPYGAVPPAQPYQSYPTSPQPGYGTPPAMGQQAAPHTASRPLRPTASRPQRGTPHRRRARCPPAGRPTPPAATSTATGTVGRGPPTSPTPAPRRPIRCNAHSGGSACRRRPARGCGRTSRSPGSAANVGVNISRGMPHNDITTPA